MRNPKNRHELVETNTTWLIIFTVIAISFGGMVEIIPLFFQQQTNEPVEGLRPTRLWKWKVVTCTSVMDVTCVTAR